MTWESFYNKMSSLQIQQILKLTSASVVFTMLKFAFGLIIFVETPH